MKKRRKKRATSKSRNRSDDDDDYDGKDDSSVNVDEFDQRLERLSKSRLFRHMRERDTETKPLSID